MPAAPLPHPYTLLPLSIPTLTLIPASLPPITALGHSPICSHASLPQPSRLAPTCSLPSAGDRSNIILGVPMSNNKEQDIFKDNIIKQKFG